MSLISMHSVNKSFGPLNVLKSMDLEINSGGIYGFLGENASGKTTTLRLLMGLLEPESGTISVLDENPALFSMQTKSRIAYVQEDQVLPEWMKADALGKFHGAHYPKWNYDEFRRLCELFRVPLKSSVSALSKGSKRKLALALAFASGADLYILDEPASGLDPNARMDFIDVLAGLFQETEKTVLFSTHLLTDLEKIADYALMLYDGKIVMKESLDDLREHMVRIHVNASLDPALIRTRFNVLDTDKAITQGDFVIIDNGHGEAERFIESQGGLARKMPFSLDDLFRRITRKEEACREKEHA